MRQLSFGNRTLVLIHASENKVISELESPFAILLSAETVAPSIEQKSIVDSAMANGCVEFCCVGKYSEELHDAIDTMLEESGHLHVVTTWHHDEPLEDSIFYFVNLAGSKPPTLVAVVDGEYDLQHVLLETISQGKAQGDYKSKR